MLREEAAWLARIISTLPSSAFPLLDLGSSTANHRFEDQTFIDTEIFAPLQRSGHGVIHADLKAAPGVDIALDFTRPDDRRRLADSTHFGSVLCANMFEHLDIAPEEAATHLLDLCAPDTYLLVTVPKSFRYHPDPIDNMYRPDGDELAGLFRERVKVLASENIQAGLQVVHDIRRRGALRYVASMLMPWRMSRVWLGKLSHSLRRIRDRLRLHANDVRGTALTALHGASTRFGGLCQRRSYYDTKVHFAIGQPTEGQSADDSHARPNG